MAKKNNNTTSIGFEDAIWRAADKLRGNLNAAEYEGVVLGLIFLKYISDKFDAKFAELSQDEYADVEDKDEYEADGVFFVPQDARWQVISLAAHTPEIGRVIDDARNMGTMVTRAVRELMQDDILRIAETFDSYRNGSLEDEAGYCAVKTLEDIKAQDFILTPGRYVGIAEQEDDGEPFADKMQRLTSELSGLFTESHRLEEEIKKQLDSIGFGIE